MDFIGFVFLLAIWGIISPSIYLLLKNDERFAEKKKKFFLLALVALGLLLPLYAKFGLSVGFVFNSSDEQILVQNFNEFLNLGDISLLLHASGPGTIAFFYILKLLSNLTLSNLMIFAGIINSILSAVLIYLLFKRVSKSQRLSFGGAFLVLSSSYLIWPIIEVRPQQIGLPMLLLCVIFLIDYFEKDSRKYLLLSSLLIVSAAMLHALTFLFLLPIIFALSLYYFEKSGEKRVTSKKFVVPLIAWIVGMIMINSFFYIIYDIQWVLRQKSLSALPQVFSEMINLPFNITIFFPLLVAFFLIIATLLLAEFLLVKWKRIAKKIREIVWVFLHPYFKKTAIAFLAISAVLASVYILSDIPHVFEWYGSVWKFFLLEAGNLLIGFLGVFGLLLALRNTREKILRLPALILLVFALCFAFALALGFFLIYGYSNFSMRILNYAIIFLGFFGFITLSWLYNAKKWRYVVFLVLLLFPCSLIVGTRDPNILNIKVTYKSVQNFTELQEIEEWNQRGKTSYFDTYRINDNFGGIDLNQSLDIVFWGKARFVTKENGESK